MEIIRVIEVNSTEPINKHVLWARPKGNVYDLLLFNGDGWSITSSNIDQDALNKMIDERVSKGLEGKQDTLVSGLNIATINNESIINNTRQNINVISDKDGKSGMARVFLPNKHTLVQSDFPTNNTIYIIQYDYNLGEDITIPENCVLKFDGGSFKDGNLHLNNTIIESSRKCFNNVNFYGKIDGIFNLKWIGVESSNTDCGPILKEMPDLFKNAIINNFVLNENVVSKSSKINMFSDLYLYSDTNSKIYFDIVNIVSDDYCISLSDRTYLRNIRIECNKEFAGKIVTVDTEIYDYERGLSKPHRVNMQSVSISQEYVSGYKYLATGIFIQASNRLDNEGNNNYLTGCYFDRLDIRRVGVGVDINIHNYNYDKPSVGNPDYYPFAWANSLFFEYPYVEANGKGIDIKFVDEGIQNKASSVSPFVFEVPSIQSNTDCIPIYIDGKVQVFMKHIMAYDSPVIGVLKNGASLNQDTIVSKGFGWNVEEKTDDEGHSYKSIMGFNIYDKSTLNETKKLVTKETIYKPGFNVNSGYGRARRIPIVNGEAYYPEQTETRIETKGSDSYIRNDSIVYVGGRSSEFISKNKYDLTCSHYGQSDYRILMRYRPTLGVDKFVLPEGVICYRFHFNNLEKNKYYKIKITPKYGDGNTAFGTWDETNQKISSGQISTCKDFDTIVFNMNGYYCDIVDYIIPYQLRDLTLFIKAKGDGKPYVNIYVRHSLSMIATNDIIYNDIYITEADIVTTDFTHPNGRPKDAPIGFQIFENGKPLWYKGSNQWVDANGTEV